MSFLYVETVVFELVDEIAQDIYIVRSDNKSAVGHFFNLAILRIGDAAQKVHQTAGDIFVSLFKIEHNRALFTQMVGYLGRVFKLFRFYQYNSKLRGCIDIDDFITGASKTGDIGCNALILGLSSAGLRDRLKLLKIIFKSSIKLMLVFLLY